jgi:hypothetical protein
MTTTDRESRPDRAKGRTRKLIVASAAALVASAAMAAGSWAMPSGDGVRDGHNVAVFHNLDFVAAFGYPVGETLKIEVFRGPDLIGTATGPAQNIDEGLPLNGALEVNHGPEGAPQPGDCWDGPVPNVRPGDRVVVTGGGGTDEVLVDNIAITKGPHDVTATADRTDVALEGRASYADGRPIPVARLDSGEIRYDRGDKRLRAVPNSVERIRGTADRWRATYKAPYKTIPGQLRGNWADVQEKKRAIINGAHAMGYGHTAPLPLETQLVDFPSANGPALGC